MPDAATYSVAEAAQMLGVGERTVYQAVREGRLPALRIGRKPKLRVPRVAVEELLRHPERWDEAEAK
jgi:excisionase family DNA binding protein